MNAHDSISLRDACAAKVHDISGIKEVHGGNNGVANVSEICFNISVRRKGDREYAYS
jgi:hypothetical protein